MANKFSFEDPVDLRGSRRAGGGSGDSDVAAFATPKGGVPDFASVRAPKLHPLAGLQRRP